LKEDPEARWVLDSYDFHIIPVVNPDGQQPQDFNSTTV
jgi:murein tripeptide amidase MpaA